MTNKPQTIRKEEWEEIIKMPEVRESFGLGDHDTADSFAEMVYGAKFHYISGGPGYVGDLYILFGDVPEEPLILTKERDGALKVN